MQGTYELSRDNIRHPSCWYSLDNTCPPHFHSSIEIVYVLDGSFRATLNGEPHLVRQGEILITSSYTVHYYSPEHGSRSIILIVPLDFVPAYSDLLAKKTFSQCVYDPGADRGELLHCLRRILIQPATEGSLNIIRGYLYVILGMLTEKISMCDVTGDDERGLTREILIYLQNNYLSDVSLESLAQHFGYSKSRFSHVFGAHFGCGLPQYVSTLRCRHAASLLASSATPTEAAMSSGFDSMRTFYRCFRRCFGMTPADYRQNAPGGAIYE